MKALRTTDEKISSCHERIIDESNYVFFNQNDNILLEVFFVSRNKAKYIGLKSCSPEEEFPTVSVNKI